MHAYFFFILHHFPPKERSCPDYLAPVRLGPVPPLFFPLVGPLVLDTRYRHRDFLAGLAFEIDLCTTYIQTIPGSRIQAILGSRSK
jgi:hypothetical protein